MMAIKIQCGCGQNYQFEIEPVSGQMPAAIACPACGVDGTDAANAAIAQAKAPPAGAATRGPSLQLAASVTPAPTSPRRPIGRLPGQVDADQAEHEARAKISWGDSPPSVIAYLKVQGFSAEDAAAMVQEMYAERTTTIRANGIRKIAIGSGLICVPIASFFYLFSSGYSTITIRLFVATVAIGLWGGWWVFQGIFMVAAPKMESGDVMEE